MARASVASTDIFSDAHIAARGDLVTVDDPVIGAVRQQAPYPRYLGTDVVVPSGAPVLGADTRDVLASLGLSDADLDALADNGIT